jgi:arsenical pump membrane protein
MDMSHLVTWVIAALAILGVIVRPWQLSEAIWAVLAVVALLVLGLISVPDAGRAVLKGTDVYLFLIGMMVLAELARHEGLFDWLAAVAVQKSAGSASRLFAMIYIVGTIVTIFLSNDATAVVLTPAVYAATRHAKANPLPYLFICAFIANAASFVLPISNPANLVVYGAHMPALGIWLAQFALPAVLSISVTFVGLRLLQTAELSGDIARDISVPTLSRGGRVAAGGIALAALVLLVASSLRWQLGLPTFLASCSVAAVILVLNRRSPWEIARHISWKVLPLVAGLFVLVAAVEGTGILLPLTAVLRSSAATAPHVTSFVLASAAAFLCNAINNLPLGLIAGTAVNGAHLPPHMTGAVLLGVDLGPNLSVTGSLATILWLVALRREGQTVTAWSFLRLGCVLMPLALVVALAAFVWLG